MKQKNYIENVSFATFMDIVIITVAKPLMKIKKINEKLMACKKHNINPKDSFKSLDYLNSENMASTSKKAHQ